MEHKLHYNTTSSHLLGVLKTLMAAKEFDAFRLVGGTALSLLRGHRESIDIDLFSDAPYGSIDFETIDAFLRQTFTYVDASKYKVVGLGESYFLGKSKDDCVKLDLFYTNLSSHPILIKILLQNPTQNEDSHLKKWLSI